MKRRILTQFVAAAAGITLPLSVFAQDSLDQTSSGTSDTTSGVTDPAAQSGASSGTYGSGGTFSGSTNQSSQNQPGTFSSGIMVHNGEAYIVHRLQNEMPLPDGSKVQPNGIVRENDGSTRSIGSGKVLTLDGREMDAPFKGDQGSSSSSSPGIFSSPNTPGSSTGVGGTSGTTENPGNSSSSGLPPTTSTQSSTSGQAGSDSSLTPNPSTPNDGSGLAPDSISTDPGQDYTD